MLDESKAIVAKEIVENPDSIYSLMRSHILISDSSMNATFSNLMDAVEICVEAGWDVINMAYDGGYMFVMMKNPNYKRKNSGG
ncbi:MAG: hypothetical protein Phog2KO_41210 [Phototrophicaceae bacterium]